MLLAKPGSITGPATDGPAGERHKPRRPQPRWRSKLDESKSLARALPPGQRARLRRLLFDSGRIGTLMLCPSTSIAHGPRASTQPGFQGPRVHSTRRRGRYRRSLPVVWRPKYYPDYGARAAEPQGHVKTDVAALPPPKASPHHAASRTRCGWAQPRAYTPYVGSSAPGRVPLHTQGRVD